jgi:hypothetical protein
MKTAMTELISTLVGLALAVLFVLLAMWAGHGNLPGEKLYHTYRLHRDSYDCGRLTALRKAWFIWKPWL